MHHPIAHFETRLREFFERHDPSKEELAHVIAKRFHLHQDEVFVHLTDIYNRVAPKKEDSLFEMLMKILYPQEIRV